MTDHEYASRLDELDRLLNDPDVPMDPARVWSLLADLSHHDGPGTTGHEARLATGLAQATRPTVSPDRTPAPHSARPAKAAEYRDLGLAQVDKDPFGGVCWMPLHEDCCPI